MHFHHEERRIAAQRGGRVDGGQRTSLRAKLHKKRSSMRHFSPRVEVGTTHTQRTAKTKPQLSELQSPAERLAAFCRSKCEYEAGKQVRPWALRAAAMAAVAAKGRVRRQDEQALHFEGLLTEKRDCGGKVVGGN